jgi:hypothetical protein
MKRLAGIVVSGWPCCGDGGGGGDDGGGLGCCCSDASMDLFKIGVFVLV